MLSVSPQQPRTRRPTHWDWCFWFLKVITHAAVCVNPTWTPPQCLQSWPYQQLVMYGQHNNWQTLTDLCLSGSTPQIWIIYGKVTSQKFGHLKTKQLCWLAIKLLSLSRPVKSALSRCLLLKAGAGPVRHASYVLIGLCNAELSWYVTDWILL